MTDEPVKISLCMIVKDEEAVLPRCISSVRNLVDEMIIVDTGSTDSTKKIAESFGAQVFAYPWDDDFSNARNFSLSCARGEWILVMDADEILAHEGKEAFTKLLEDDGVEGYFIRIVNLLGEPSHVETSEDMVVRLFRNRLQYRFEGAIHEQVRPAIVRFAGENTLKMAPLAIYHDGYLSAVIYEKDKVMRNSRVIRKALADNPANPFLLYSLGCEHIISNDFQGALEFFKQALSRISTGDGYLPDLVLKTGLCLYKLGKIPEMRGLLTHYQELSPLTLELLFLSGLANLDTGRLNEAEQDMKDCLVNMSSPAEHNLGIGKHQVYQALGEIYEAKEFGEEAIKFYFCAIKENPYYLYPLKRIIDIYRRQEQLPKIDGFLDFCPTDTRSTLLRKLDWEKEADVVICLILGLVQDGLISDVNARRDILNRLLLIINEKQGDLQNLRVTTAALLAKAVITLAACKSFEIGNPTDISEKIKQNIADILFCKGDW